MPVFYEIDKEQGLVITRGSGEVTLNEMLDHQNRLAEDRDFDPKFSQLIDTTEPTHIELTSEVIRRLALRNLFSNHSRRAIVAKTDFVYAHARMFEMLRELEGEEGIRVFRTHEEAYEWIVPKCSPA